MSGDSLSRYRAIVLSDSDLQRRLGALTDAEAFAAVVLADAGARGIVLDPDGLEAALRPDPLGVARMAELPVRAERPPVGWLPINLIQQREGPCVDWAYFAKGRPLEPFFGDSVRAALRRPLNLFVQVRTALRALPKMTESTPFKPSGFIFHMSRCGSTLVSQMLASDDRNLVISEASPIDQIVLNYRQSQPADLELHASLLAGLVRAFANGTETAPGGYVIKLDSWHTLAAELFRAAFPSVPWVFLYRDPAEVLASHNRSRGIQSVPEYMPPALYGLTDADAFVPNMDYCAKVLARLSDAVLPMYAAGNGLLINYTELPGAALQKIQPHFRIQVDDRGRTRMIEAAKMDAKAPGMPFVQPDNDTMERMDALRGIGERWVGGVYRRLEALRARQ